MNVLVIPEDFRKDQYVLQPIVEAMLAEVGKPRAKVIVCRDPLLGGVEQALDWRRIRPIIDRYRGMVHLFLLIVDRDAVAPRRGALNLIEKAAGEVLPPSRALFGENAWQEVEVWALAGIDLPREWSWAEVRLEPHAKEKYFEPRAAELGLSDEPGGGRKTLGWQAAANYRRVRQICPEDVQALERCIASWAAAP